MGRMRKQTVEYFPHFATAGRTLYILEKKWGNDGYAFWFKLLELLCVQEGHYYKCETAIDLEYLASNASMEGDKAEAILSMLASMGNIDADLWEQERIIWCQSLVDNLAPLYSKRTSALPKKPLLPGEVEEQPGEGPELARQEPEAAEVKKNTPKKKTAATKKPKEPKHKYGMAQKVLLTDAEYQRLVEKTGSEAKTKACIEKLDGYKDSKGAKYSSDYRAILNWVIDAVDDDIAKGKIRLNDDGNAGDFTGGFRPSEGFQNTGAF